MLKSWSFSSLSTYETCPYRTKLRVIDKIPEPERPLPEGKTEHANDRGTRIHDGCERFVRGEGELPAEAAVHFKPYLMSLAEHYKAGKIQMEEEWGFNRDWEPCDYKGAWLKVKLDVFYRPEKTHAVILDYKTGRKDNNEIKHGKQMGLYAIAAACRYPELQEIDTELLYLDQKPAEPGKKYSNHTFVSKPVDKWLYPIKLWTVKADKMLRDTQFKPTPNAFSCQYCPYKEGICQYAYTDKKAISAIHQRRAVSRKGAKAI